MDINLKSNNKKKSFLSKFDTIRIKLFITLTITIAVIILFLVVINSAVLERYYIYSKQSELMTAYKAINSYYNGTTSSTNIEIELERLALSNNFDILIRTDNSIYTSSRDFVSSLTDEFDEESGSNENILYNSENVKIKRSFDRETEMSFILLSAKLDNGYQLYIRYSQCTGSSAVAVG